MIDSGSQAQLFGFGATIEARGEEVSFRLAISVLRKRESIIVGGIQRAKGHIFFF